MDETTLEEKYKRLLIILQARNQIIKAQRGIIERQEEAHRQFVQWGDCRCGIGELHRDPGDETDHLRPLREYLHDKNPGA